MIKITYQQICYWIKMKLLALHMCVIQFLWNLKWMLGWAAKDLSLSRIFLISYYACETNNFISLFPPSVSIFPNLKQVYSGDFLYLTCENHSSEVVRWFFRNQEQAHPTEKTWRIAAARGEHSGSYHCVANSVPSEKLFIDILGECSTTA